jgi:hypothetical protein
MAIGPAGLPRGFLHPSSRRATRFRVKTDYMTTDDGLLLKMGRNLVLFQQIEHILKGLVALSALKTTPSNSLITTDPVLKQSLGLVAAAFIQRTEVVPRNGASEIVVMW